MNINHKDWTLYNRNGFIEERAVEVHRSGDGTTRINATLHNDSDLTISDDGQRIDSVNGWYLMRTAE